MSASIFNVINCYNWHSADTHAGGLLKACIKQEMLLDMGTWKKTGRNKKYLTVNKMMI